MSPNERRTIALVIAAAALVLATKGDSTALLVWGGSVAIVIGAGMWWNVRAWWRVEMQLSFDPKRAFIGEPIDAVVRIRNPRRLPIPIARFAVGLPEGVTDGAGGSTVRRRLFVPGRAQTEVRFPLAPHRRGEYWPTWANASLADPFDLVSVSRDLPCDASFLVMPATTDGIPIELARRLPYGSPVATVRLYEDPERFAGVREYERGDPLNRIHWKLSGHSGGYQTKRFEATRSADVLLAIDLARGEPFWLAADQETAEHEVALAATVARRAIHAGWRTGLVANTRLRRSGGAIRLAIGASATHDRALLSLLARMPAQPTGYLGPALRDMGRTLPRRTTVVVFTAEVTPLLEREVHVLRRRGCDVVLIGPDGSREHVA
jgi:uncharacterized protein (DUF58 family)